MIVDSDSIALKRQLIQRIKTNHQEKLDQANLLLDSSQPERPPRSQHPHTSTSTVVPITQRPPPPPNQPHAAASLDKNPGVSDTDRMLFDKKFKNFLNHRQQYLDKARKRNASQGALRRSRGGPRDLGEAEYYNQQEVLSNTGSEYQYHNATDMHAAYEQMTTGKKRGGGKGELFPEVSYQNELRKFEFAMLLGEAEKEEQEQQAIAKERVLNYLFDEPIIMMLYSINPYQLGDQLAEFQTKVMDLMDYGQFSAFLLTDREPTYFDYTHENMTEARKLGRGIKCAPIIGKWIDESGIFQLLVQTFRQLDIRGDSRVDRSFLARKLRRQASTRRISQVQVIQIVNINKRLPLNRILYELQYQIRDDPNWSQQEFINFLQNYKRRQTPAKDKLITKLILTGKYDSSYIYVVSSQVLEIVREVFEKTPKFAQYFVLKEKFIKNFCQDPRYKRIQGMFVRAEANRYVKKETVEDTLVRMLAEAETYMDIQEIMEFMTNRGRPKIIEYRVYLENLYRQLAVIEEEERRRSEKHGESWQTTSSDDQFDAHIRQKQKQRKHNKLQAIHNANNFDPSKKFNVTIPQPFGFDARDKKKSMGIRQRKLKEMLQEKERKYQEEIKPIPPKEVPEYVKENMYQRMLKEQERERKERVQKFRLEIMSQIQVSDRLMRPKSKDLHCCFPGKPYEFVARPMPWYCEVNLLERYNKKKQERSERILEEVINKHADFDLPEGVQRMMERQAERRSRRQEKDRTASTGSIGQCTFQPKITQGTFDPKHFQFLHNKFELALENAKAVNETTQLMPFSFDNRPTKSRTTYEQAKPLRPEKVRLSKYEKIEDHEEFKNIPKTEKYEALVELRRRQAQEKEEEVEKEQRNDAVRKLRESKFAPVVQKVIKRSSLDPSKSRAIIAEKIKEFKREERKKKEEYENQMIKILTKVYERPLLLEGDHPEAAQYPMPVLNSKPRKGKQSQNERDFLQQGYLGRQQKQQQFQPPRAEFKLNLGKQSHPHMNDEQRRAAIEGHHHLGQYPAEAFEQQYQEDEDEDEFQESDLYGQEYEGGVGNLHTS